MSRISQDLAAHHSHSRSPARTISSQQDMNNQTPEVAIIGAGLAGLRCADVLVRNGANVTIFEARNRIGGRVHQHHTAIHAFDMGPNWIHGTDGNPMMDLATKTNTTILEPEEEQLVFNSEGQLKDVKDAVALGADTWHIIASAFKYSNENHNEIDPQTSLYDYFQDQLKQKYPNGQDQLNERLNEARMWGPFVGSAVDRQSLRNFFLEECLDGENVIVASTYKKILQEVAQKALSGSDIRLNEEVTKVEYRSSNGNSPVALTTAKGERHAFDEIVVTCPLGWLKRNHEVFCPSLPKRLSQAINNIGYGNLEKVYVTFPSAWWMNDIEETMVNGNSDSSTRSHSSTNPVPLFVHFHHPAYHPHPASKETEFWNQSMVNLALLPGDSAQPTLLFYMYGECSLYMTSLIKDYEIGSDTCNTILYDFVKPFFSRLPQYSASNPACEPVSFVATTWSNDPYAGYGSYSNFQIGLLDGAEDIKCMRDAGGLSDEGKGLWLAGEHTAPFIAVGTSTGAYWSGEAVAWRILERYHGEDAVDIQVD